ncbi:20877_t:CDS:2, partial [Entrophospora sp. SA101]
MTIASIPGNEKTIIEAKILNEEEIMVEDDKETIIKVNLLDVSEMDKAVRSRLELDWNFMPGIIGHVSLVEFFHIIIDRFPVIHVCLILSSTFRSSSRQNPPVPDGTNGYFSVAAGDFVQEKVSEKRQVSSEPFLCVYLDPEVWIRRRPESKTIVLNDEQLNAAIPRKFLDTSFFSNSQ